TMDLPPPRNPRRHSTDESNVDPAAATGGSRTAAGFIGRSSGRAKPGSGSRSGSTYGTGRPRRSAD
ncbi:hypothetical protein, partial [Kitasatospora sp. NPDC059571]|uniref:hypothetical protein n=1 Tax=Kitasatospora sp. NPDC059571 TaxID=3346871 RepID=UPI0036A7096E